MWWWKIVSGEIEIQTKNEVILWCKKDYSIVEWKFEVKFFLITFQNKMFLQSFTSEIIKCQLETREKLLKISRDLKLSLTLLEIVGGFETSTGCIIV